MEKNKTTSVFSKIFTVAFLVAILALLIFVYIFIGTVKDFTKPISFKIDQNTYDYTIDEFVEFLNEKDYMEVDGVEVKYIGLEGVTDARKYGDTYVLYWDVNSMDKDSVEYKTWQIYANIGNMTLADANQTKLVVYGCFAVNYKEKAEGVTEETYKVLEKFPMEYSGKHDTLTAWDMTFDQFLDYMVQKGHFDLNNKVLMTTIGTENWIISGVDVMWWDVENLIEGTEEYDYWQQEQENGYMMFAGTVYMPMINGPFGIKAQAGFAGNVDQLYEDFMNFPKGYTPSEQ